MQQILMLVIFCAGGGTYLLRSVPLVIGSHVPLPGWLKEYISFMTPAILGALLGPSLLLPDGQWLPPWTNATLWAALPTALIAWRTRSLFLTILAGVVCFAIARSLLVSHSIG